SGDRSSRRGSRSPVRGPDPFSSGITAHERTVPSSLSSITPSREVYSRGSRGGAVLVLGEGGIVLDGEHRARRAEHDTARGGAEVELADGRLAAQPDDDQARRDLLDHGQEELPDVALRAAVDGDLTALDAGARELGPHLGLRRSGHPALRIVVLVGDDGEALGAVGRVAQGGAERGPPLS